MIFYQLVIIVILLSIINACQNKGDCNVRELSNQELYDRALSGNFIPDNTPYFLPNGKQITRDSLGNFDRNDFALSQFVDCNDSIIRLVIRAITEDDIDLRTKIDSLYQSNMELARKRILHVEKDTILQNQMIRMAIFNSPLNPYEVDCSKIEKLIDSAFIKDQVNRSNINLLIDRENTELIESIKLHCGFDKIVDLGQDAVYKTFMIIQHGPSKIRRKYLEIFIELSRQGHLDSSELAMMIDRTLIESGEKQLYGTQFKKDIQSGEIEFLPIEDPKNVDKRRADMNLGKLEEYLQSIKNL